MTPAEFALVYGARQKALAEAEERANYRTAAMMALHANLNRDPKKRATPFTADDFLSKAPAQDTPRKVKRAQTSEEMLRTAEVITRMLGGKVLRKQQGATKEG